MSWESGDEGMVSRFHVRGEGVSEEGRWVKGVSEEGEWFEGEWKESDHK